MTANLYAAWIAFFLGSLAGLVSGVFFHRESWLGGYGSWSRRMVRLGHIAWFGIGILNLAFALTVRVFGIEGNAGATSVLLIVGVVTMPLVCYLSAFRAAYRHLFAVPALSVLVGIALFVWRLVAT